MRSSVPSEETGTYGDTRAEVGAHRWTISTATLEDG